MNVPGDAPADWYNANYATRASVKQTARPLLARLQPELLGIERPCSLQILGGQPGGDTTVFEHRQSFRLSGDKATAGVRPDRVQH